MSDIVYRLENEDHKGPFAATGHFDNWGKRIPSAQEIADRGAEYDRMAEVEGGGPYPQFDGMGVRPPFPNGKFGFANLEQLGRWFSDEQSREWLVSQGFRIVAYTTSQMVRGRHQVYFCPAGIKRLVGWEEVP